MKHLFKTLLIVLAIFAMSFQTKATHTTGGDVSYECIGQDSFIVTLRLFRDCSGVGLPVSANMSFTSSCTSFSQTLPKISFEEVSQLCASQLMNSTCNGGWLPGMEMHVYEAIVVFPVQCSDWNMAFSTCCHNTTVNLQWQPGYWIDANMDNLVDDCNSSPKFTAQPIPYVCINQPVTYNYGVVELDGDSLYFSPICVRDGLFSCVGYNNPYTFNIPILNGFTLDPNTGQISFTPNTIGNFAIAMQCEEFDPATGNLLGITMREMQVVVISCTNQMPSDTSGYITSFITNGGILTSPYSMQLCPGDSISFDVCIYDPDPGDTIALTSNVTLVLPGATFVSTPGNPACATITWVAPLNQGFFNAFTVVAEDDACPVTGIQTYVYVVEVLTSAYAGPDQTICLGDSADLLVTGGNQFTWTVINGDPMNVGTNFTCDTCSSPTSFPDSTTTYLVITNLGGNCDNVDTVTVYVTRPLNPQIDPIGPFCDYDAPVGLTADTNGGSWLGAGVNGPFFDPALAGAGNWLITYNMPNQGCPDSGTFTVTVNPEPPVPTSTGNSYCKGDPVTGINAIGEPGAELIWYEGNLFDVINHGNPLEYGFADSTNTIWFTQTVDGCVSQPGSIQLIVWPSPSADFTTDPPLGTNPLPLTGNGYAPLDVDFTNMSLGGTGPWDWEWEVNGDPSSNENESATFDEPGTYIISITVTDANGCASEYTDSVIVDGIAKLIIPNVFTPNGPIDELTGAGNNAFQFKVSGIDGMDVVIYNRWGRKVHEWSFPAGDAASIWDRGPDGKGYIVTVWDGGKEPDGTYYYIISNVTTGYRDNIAYYYYNQQDPNDEINGKVFTEEQYAAGCEHCVPLKGHVTMIGSGR